MRFTSALPRISAMCTRTSSTPIPRSASNPSISDRPTLGPNAPRRFRRLEPT
jgi:hypothetical protein